MKTMNAGHGMNLQQSVGKKLGLVALATAAILLVPFIAMQFTSEVNWTMSDFAIAGMLLAGMGLAYVLTTMTMRNPRTRLVTGAAFAVALLLIWAELAVGLAGTPFAGS
jgi:vacuolar-type H+-ATPase subunit I/STV1